VKWLLEGCESSRIEASSETVGHDTATTTIGAMPTVATVPPEAPDVAEGVAQAGALTPRPALIVVLTDGWTPWPDQAPPA
jgi:hypothetical protein